MPSCFAPGCANQKTVQKHLIFYRFPQNEKRKQLWSRAKKREGYPKELLIHARFCSEHFISGWCIIIFRNTNIKY